MANDPFRDALLRRIDNYRAAESAAWERLRALQAEVDRLRHRREAAETLYEAEYGERVRATETLAEAELEEQREFAAPATQSRRSNAKPIPGHDGRFTGMHWEEAIEYILREEGGPLHVNEIWRRLRDGGFQTASMDPVRSVVAIAVRSPRLSKAAPNTYALVEGS